MSRKVTHYSEEFKEGLLAKLLSPQGPSTVELAKASGVPYPTLYTWVKMKKQKSNQSAEKHILRPQDYTAEAKLRAVLETLDMTESERGAYCREHGLYTHHLEAWKAQILQGLAGGMPKKDKGSQQQLTQENKQLKSELTRKDKALAEASALLILKKKADLIWGNNEGD